VISKPGTDLGRALRAASEVFDPDSSRPRAVLLLSDGEHAGSNLSATVGEVRSRGIRVVAVGFGTPEGGVVPGPGADPLRDRDGRAVRSRRADALLERIARGTGGRVQLEDDDPPEPRALASSFEPEVEEEDERELLPLWLVVAALALATELFLSSPSPLTSVRRKAWAVATVAAAIALLGAGAPGWLREGDAMLERGEARAALSTYRRVERTSGETAATRIRVGNALYRMGQLGSASASFLDALRQLGPDDRDARFVAAFNLGTSLLAQERYGEARDAFWTALLARPERREAKFNYEWAVERIEPEEHPAAASPRRPDSEPHERDREMAGPYPSPPPGAEEREHSPPPLEEHEAKRWLRAIEDRPLEPLRQQIAERLESEGRRAPGGQTW
jgi:Ca-activated chloride channel family protein